MKSKIKQIPLDITFKNARGDSYYTIIETGSKGVNVVTPTKKIGLEDDIRLKFRSLQDKLTMYLYKIIWRFKK